WRVFDNRVLIYIHKEEELADVERLYPAKHYVLIDDKLRILSAVKKIWGERVTTVFPKQGHYALDPKTLAEYPPADIELARIGDLINCDLSAFKIPAGTLGRKIDQSNDLGGPTEEAGSMPAAPNPDPPSRAELKAGRVVDRTILIITGVSGSGKTT